MESLTNMYQKDIYMDTQYFEKNKR